MLDHFNLWYPYSKKNKKIAHSLPKLHGWLLCSGFQSTIFYLTRTFHEKTHHFFSTSESRHTENTKTFIKFYRTRFSNFYFSNITSIFFASKFRAPVLCLRRKIRKKQNNFLPFRGMLLLAKFQKALILLTYLDVRFHVDFSTLRASLLMQWSPSATFNLIRVFHRTIHRFVFAS